MDLQGIIGDSKTERMLILILVLIVLFGVLAVVILVLFDKSILEIMIAVYGALGLNGAGSLIRNIKVDAPIRQQEALVQTAQTAKSQNLTVPIAPAMATPNAMGVNTAGIHSTPATQAGLQVWKPEENKP